MNLLMISSVKLTSAERDEAISALCSAAFNAVTVLPFPAKVYQSIDGRWQSIDAKPESPCPVPA